MSNAQFGPNDYQREDEHELAQMSVLPEGRDAEVCRASAPDLFTLAQQIGDVVTPDPRVSLVYVFGSRAQGDPGPMSDLDLAVLLTRTAPVAALRAELAHEFSAFSNGFPVDLIILNHASIELAFSVVSQGKVLFERSLAERVEYEADVLSRYGDYLPFLRAQRKDILEGAGNDRRVQRYREALGRTERTLGTLGTIKGTTAR
jgi:predicted nucleotidyltransferase